MRVRRNSDEKSQDGESEADGHQHCSKKKKGERRRRSSRVMSDRKAVERVRRTNLASSWRAERLGFS